MPVPQRRGEPVMVDTDEHPRETSLEALARLRPIAPGGTVTAGNASGINDGAAAVLVASERAVPRYGLTPLARVTAGAAAGVEPQVMGIGPVRPPGSCWPATGLAVDDLDLVELNEAFAAQALAVLRASACPTTPSTSTPTAEPSRSATRWAPAAPGSP